MRREELPNTGVQSVHEFCPLHQSQATKWKWEFASIFSPIRISILPPGEKISNRCHALRSTGATSPWVS